MRKFRILLLAATTLTVLVVPSVSAADAGNLPASANWYFYVDLKRMRSDGPGEAIYDWLRDEVLEEIKEDAGIDIENELDRVTAYSSNKDDGVLILDGNISQQTRDIALAFIASGGDPDPLKTSGKTYYRFGGDETIDDDVSYDAGNIAFDIESLGEESWISMAVKNKVIVTSTEAHMKELLRNNGKFGGQRGANGVLLVLSADKTLLQAGMKSEAIGEDDWDSRLLSNTEELAFLIAIAGDKLAVEAKLVTTEAEVAESLAGVARGLISLASFDDELDPETAALLRGTKVSAKGNSLSVSLAIDPGLLVSTLSD